MKMFFDVNNNDEIMAMGTSPVGYTPVVIEIDENLLSDLQQNFSSYKVLEGKLIKSSVKELASKRELKKEELSIACQDSIVEGFDFEHNGLNYHFSYDQEAQANLSERFNLFQNDMISEITITAHLNESSHRLVCNKKLFDSIYIASVKHKENCISKYRDHLLPLVEKALTVEGVESITWDTVIIEPIISPVTVNEDNMLDKQINEAKIAQAEGDLGLLTMLYTMGVLG